MNRYHLFLLVSFAAVFIWSAILPFDPFTWYLEALPPFVGLVVILATYRRFTMTSLTYTAIWIFAVIIMTGAHYTYERVPLGDMMKDLFGFHRNHFDRVGHFIQGVTPAIIARELLLRTSPLKPGKWLFFIVVSIALAISAMYELFEAGMAIGTGTAADAFVGMQGDIWDAQKDMTMAFCGSIVAQVLFSRMHDRMLKGIQNTPSQS